LKVKKGGGKSGARKLKMICKPRYKSKEGLGGREFEGRTQKWERHLKRAGKDFLKRHRRRRTPQERHEQQGTGLMETEKTKGHLRVQKKPVTNAEWLLRKHPRFLSGEEIII